MLINDNTTEDNKIMKQKEVINHHIWLQHWLRQMAIDHYIKIINQLPDFD